MAGICALVKRSEGMIKEIYEKNKQTSADADRNGGDYDRSSGN